MIVEPSTTEAGVVCVSVTVEGSASSVTLVSTVPARATFSKLPPVFEAIDTDRLAVPCRYASSARTT